MLQTGDKLGSTILNKVYGMLELQADNNDLTRPDWRTAKFNWMDAIMVEGVEAFDSLAWKWWKKGGDDLDNCKMELVDIWHFLMSWAMVNYISAEELSTIVFGGDDETLQLKYEVDVTKLKAAIRLIIFEASQGTHMTSDGEVYKSILLSFSQAISSLFESTDEFVKLYVAKNALNRFRQANGYKDGSYIKIWTVIDGVDKEDNHFVHTYLASVEQIPEVDLLLNNLLGYLDVVYGAVKNEYQDSIDEIPEVVDYDTLTYHGLINLPETSDWNGTGFSEMLDRAIALGMEWVVTPDKYKYRINSRDSVTSGPDGMGSDHD